MTPASLQDLGHGAAGGHPQAGVEGGERLVEQHELGLAGQRPGQRDALLLAAGELVRAALGHGRVQRDHLQQLADPGLDAAAPAGQLARRPGRRRCSARRSGAGTGRRPGPRSRRGACAPGPRRRRPPPCCPFSEMLPVSGCSKPAISRSSVVLPEPDGPTIAVVPPLADRQVDALEDGLGAEVLGDARRSPGGCWCWCATDGGDPRFREPGGDVFGHCPAAFLDCWKSR